MSTRLFTRFLRRTLDTIDEWRRRRRESHALAYLSDWQRQDIGLAPATIDDRQAVLARLKGYGVGR
jgi:uncharacterized protein YjiS (DUF1127 family)